MIFSTLLDGNWALADYSIDSMNNFKNYFNEELYIQLIKDTSIMVK